MGMSRVLGFMRKADNEINLIKDGDKIAVGIFKKPSKRI